MGIFSHRLLDPGRPFSIRVLFSTGPLLITVGTNVNINTKYLTEARAGTVHLAEAPGGLGTCVQNVIHPDSLDSLYLGHAQTILVSYYVTPVIQALWMSVRDVEKKPENYEALLA